MTANPRRTAQACFLPLLPRAAALPALLAVTALLLTAASAAAQPTARDVTLRASPGVQASAYASHLFDNAGPGATITSASFSTMEYYDADNTGAVSGFLFVQPKTSDQLNALASPPDNPFRVTVTVTMTNNAGQTVDGDFEYETQWAKATPRPASPSTYDPLADATNRSVLNVRVGVLVTIDFDHVANTNLGDDGHGTNPRFTKAEFSNLSYYDESATGISSNKKRVMITTKTRAQLRALASPPPSPTFTTTVTSKFVNDEGQEFERTTTLSTTWGY